MENIFNLAERCLFSGKLSETVALTHYAKQRLDAGLLAFDVKPNVRPISDTVFPAKPVWRRPKEMPKRRLDSQEGLAAFFHALTHIEFIAIYLAWDMLYRFRGLPQAFYADWLNIADEEALHFAMLRQQLQALGCDYGDLAAHGGLWEHAVNTADDVLARLAVIPRYMEARGLDVTPAMIEKFKHQGDKASVALLSRILQDEVGHVERGSYWFKCICEQQSLEPIAHYRYLLKNYFKGIPNGPFNRELRLIAGFSVEELNWLEKQSANKFIV